MNFIFLAIILVPKIVFAVVEVGKKNYLCVPYENRF